MLHHMTVDQLVLISLSALAAVVIGGGIGRSQRGCAGGVVATVATLAVIVLLLALFKIRV